MSRFNNTISLKDGAFDEHMVMIWMAQVAPRQMANNDVAGVRKFMDSKYFKNYSQTDSGKKVLNKLNEWLQSH